MSYSPPPTQPNARLGSLWFLFLGLLLCGVMSWVSATPGAANQLMMPLFIDQAEQLAQAGSTDNLRVRPILRSDGSVPEDKDIGGSDWPFPGHMSVTLPEGLSARSVAYIFLSPHLPAPARYTLPTSREPPKA